MTGHSNSRRRAHRKCMFVAPCDSTRMERRKLFALIAGAVVAGPAMIGGASAAEHALAEIMREIDAVYELGKWYDGLSEAEQDRVSDTLWNYHKQQFTRLDELRRKVAASGWNDWCDATVLAWAAKHPKRRT